MQPTLYNRYCHSRTLFQHSSYSYRPYNIKPHGGILLSPPQRFKHLLYQSAVRSYITQRIHPTRKKKKNLWASAEERGNFKGMLDLTLESMNLLSVDINMLTFAIIIVADFSMLSYHTGEVSYLLHVILPYWCSESVLRAILVRSLRVFAFRM